MRKKLLLLLIICVIGWLYFSTHKTKALKPAMNVVLITLDTMRADRLGSYGYKKNTSPNLDRLAAESVQFDMAIAQAAVTPVSHASILTGLNPYNHGLRVMHGLVTNRLPEEQQTLAEVWQRLGGQTSAFVSAFPVTTAFGLDQGVTHFDANFQQGDGKDLVSKYGIVNTGMSQRKADKTTKEAIEWLNKKADPEKPMFMWVHYFDPHDPKLLPPQAFLEMFEPSSQKKEDILRATYDAEVSYMDYYIGKLLDSLKKNNLWKNTIIVVVADHGEGLGDHNWWSHGILYQEQIRVPLIIRVPGIKGGVRIPSLVRTIDLMPTILEAAGIDSDLWPAMDGESLIETMHQGQTKKERYAYADSVNIMSYGRVDTKEKRDQKNDKLYAIMNKTHKLIYHQLQPDKTEFYDLKTDPGEMSNLAASFPPEMQQLLHRLKSYKALSGFMPGATSSDLDRIEKLKSLGYIQ